MTAPILSARDIRKSFFGVEVLHGVSLDLRAGEVHGLVGENGAGKSTLMKIIAGVYQRDGGELEYLGQPVDYTHPIQAMHAGVATVYQEFNLLPERSVAENVFLGREPRKGGFVDNRGMAAATGKLLAELGITFIDPNSAVRTLTVAEQQIVEITKALSFDAKVISMDEPTAALADNEVELLYGIIERLKERGVAILYVSHRLKEIFDLCDTITVLKDGALVSSGAAGDLTTDELVRRMVGRSISAYFPDRREGTEIGKTRLSVRAGGNAYISDVDLDLRAGEIVGVAGLQGSGRT
jgi:ribose transport system ATP-binding protein